MRLLLVLGSISLAAVTGCAGTVGQERVVVAADAPVTRTSSQVVEVTEVVQPVAMETPAPTRPRLAQTLTLGQGSEPSYTAAPPQQAQGANGPNVIVNNNITVVGSPAGYGGYGYGGYGGYGYGGSTTSRDYGRGSASMSRGAWAPSGWEGAQRTAAPGRTPGVGGNWAPAASHGPRGLR